MSTASRELLIRARELIESGKERHVCIAVGEVAKEQYGDFFHSRAGRITRFIEDLLGEHRALESYLEENCPGYVWSILSDEKTQNTRLAWIDWMLTQPEFAEDAWN